jgi:hypothetical protein
MSGAAERAVKRFEVYRRDNGRTGIIRTLHHDTFTGRSWVTEVREKSGARGDALRVETVTELDDMDPDDRELYELRLRNELVAAQATLPAV